MASKTKSAGSVEDMTPTELKQEIQRAAGDRYRETAGALVKALSSVDNGNERLMDVAGFLDSIGESSAHGYLDALEKTGDLEGLTRKDLLDNPEVRMQARELHKNAAAAFFSTIAETGDIYDSGIVVPGESLTMGAGGSSGITEVTKNKTVAELRSMISEEAGEKYKDAVDVIEKSLAGMDEKTARERLAHIVEFTEAIGDNAARGWFDAVGKTGSLDFLGSAEVLENNREEFKDALGTAGRVVASAYFQTIAFTGEEKLLNFRLNEGAGSETEESRKRINGFRDELGNALGGDAGRANTIVGMVEASVSFDKGETAEKLGDILEFVKAAAPEIANTYVDKLTDFTQSKNIDRRVFDFLRKRNEDYSVMFYVHGKENFDALTNPELLKSRSFREACAVADAETLFEVATQMDAGTLIGAIGIIQGYSANENVNNGMVAALVHNLNQTNNSEGVTINEAKCAYAGAFLGAVMTQECIMDVGKMANAIQRDLGEERAGEQIEYSITSAFYTDGIRFKRGSGGTVGTDHDLLGDGLRMTAQTAHIYRNNQKFNEFFLGFGLEAPKGMPVTIRKGVGDKILGRYWHKSEKKNPHIEIKAGVSDGIYVHEKMHSIQFNDYAEGTMSESEKGLLKAVMEGGAEFAKEIYGLHVYRPEYVDDKAKVMHELDTLYGASNKGVGLEDEAKHIYETIKQGGKLSDVIHEEENIRGIYNHGIALVALYYASTGYDLGGTFRAFGSADGYAKALRELTRMVRNENDGEILGRMHEALSVSG